VLPTSEERKANRAMISGVLIVVAQSVHILVPPLAVTNTACIRTEPTLRLFLDFPKLRLAEGLTVIALLALPGSQKRLKVLEILRRCEIARTVGHVVLQAISLLV
jgi:hypothetical protein